MRRGCVTAISGGGVGHAMWVVREKKQKGELEGVKLVVCVVGGNDFGVRSPGGVAVDMSHGELVSHMNLFVSWMLQELPHAEIRILDIIPRDSIGGKFASGIRRWSSAVKQLDSRHRHIRIWRMFTVEHRGWKWETGKGNRGTDEAKKEKREAAAPTTVNRVELRQGLYGPDRVHLNSAGEKVLFDILSWQLENAKDSLKVSVGVFLDGTQQIVDLKASFAF